MNSYSGMKKLVVPLTLGLISGSAAFAQQPKTDASTPGSQSAPQDTTRAKDADRATDTNRDQVSGRQDNDATNDEFARTGMYDQYKTHWNARFRDDDFTKYEQQQMKMVAPNSAPNRQGTTNYEQFSNDKTAWRDSERAGQAWNQSDAYWRTSDRYWRAPERRTSDASEDYWKKSDAYWHDSETHWNSRNRDADQDNSNPRRNEQGLTNQTNQTNQTNNTNK